jgi:hypothetical protein
MIVARGRGHALSGLLTDSDFATEATDRFVSSPGGGTAAIRCPTRCRKGEDPRRGTRLTRRRKANRDQQHRIVTADFAGRLRWAVPSDEF